MRDQPVSRGGIARAHRRQAAAELIRHQERDDVIDGDATLSTYGALQRRGRLNLDALASHTEMWWRWQIVKEAMSWVGTPYHEQGDVKRTGVDCGMILVRVFVDAGLVEPFDPRPYTPDFMMHHLEERYIGIVEACGAVEIGRDPGAGDIAMWRHGHVWSHGAIVLQWPKIIHAFALCRQVIVDDARSRATLTAPSHGPPRFFSLWP
jgi:cell wall-associated NlpC family hydrolase